MSPSHLRPPFSGGLHGFLRVDPLLWLELTAFMGLAVASHFTVKKFRQPTLVGEILIGLVVGTVAAALGTGPPFRSGIISVLGLLGAVLLLFAVGLESDLRGIYSGRNVAVAMAGVILPWAGGFLLADRVFPTLFVPTVAGGPAACTQALGYFCTPLQTLAAKGFVGSTLVATSVAITASVLHETGKIRTPTAQTILGAAVVDDVLGMIVLALSVGVTGVASPLGTLPASWGQRWHSLGWLSWWTPDTWVGSSCGSRSGAWPWG